MAKRSSAGKDCLLLGAIVMSNSKSSSQRLYRNVSLTENSVSHSADSYAYNYFKTWCENNFKPRCTIRWFSSNTALLVVVWNFLSVMAVRSLDNISDHLVQGSTVVAVVPAVLWPFSAPIFGWLADIFLGHYRVSKIGMILLFVTSVFQTILLIVHQTVVFPHDVLIGLIVVLKCAGYLCLALRLVSLPQVGLDQMPDSPISKITSFISWYVASIFCGIWVSDASFNVGVSCIGKHFFGIIWSLFPVTCMCLVLISDFTLASKWLIVEPKSPKSLKTIYYVLKFAAKHKAPLNRSALTYWEEAIPSRIDLGKSRYGGPFTTEQVEDVKTLFKILTLTLPMWMCVIACRMYGNALFLLDANPVFVDNATCKSAVLTYFTYSWDMWCFLITVLFEFAMYPLIGHRIPSSVWRIGAAAFIVLVVNILCLFPSIFNLTVPMPVAYGHSVGKAFLVLLLLTSSMEFVCAQSPHNMRALLLGYIWCIHFFSYATSMLILKLKTPSTSSGLVMIHSVVATQLSSFGFVLYCLVARWYKRRVRDDDIITPHQWAEDYYDRYLPRNSNL